MYQIIDGLAGNW